MRLLVELFGRNWVNWPHLLKSPHYVVDGISVGDFKWCHLQKVNYNSDVYLRWWNLLKMVPLEDEEYWYTASSWPSKDRCYWNQINKGCIEIPHLKFSGFSSTSSFIWNQLWRKGKLYIINLVTTLSAPKISCPSSWPYLTQKKCPLENWCALNPSLRRCTYQK